MDRTFEGSGGLDKRVEKMDMDLKEHFVDQRDFISVALAGVEKRLGARIDKLEGRVGKMDRDMKAAFSGMDAKLSILIERVAAIVPGRRVRARRLRRKD